MQGARALFSSRFSVLGSREEQPPDRVARQHTPDQPDLIVELENRIHARIKHISQINDFGAKADQAGQRKGPQHKRGCRALHVLQRQADCVERERHEREQREADRQADQQRSADQPGPGKRQRDRARTGAGNAQRQAGGLGGAALGKHIRQQRHQKQPKNDQKAVQERARPRHQ